MMTETERAELVARLADWRGAQARPWTFHTSHGSFQLELRLAGRRAFVWCVGCKRLAFPRCWDDASLELEVLEDRCALRDSKAGFHAEIASIRIEEDPE